MKDACVWVASSGRVQQFRKDGPIISVHENVGSGRLHIYNDRLYTVGDSKTVQVFVLPQMTLSYTVKAGGSISGLAANDEEFFIQRMTVRSEVWVHAADGMWLRTVDVWDALSSGLVMAVGGMLFSNCRHPILPPSIRVADLEGSCVHHELADVCDIAATQDAVLGVTYNGSLVHVGIRAQLIGSMGWVQKQKKKRHLRIGRGEPSKNR